MCVCVRERERERESRAWAATTMLLTLLTTKKKTSVAAATRYPHLPPRPTPPCWLSSAYDAHAFGGLKFGPARQGPSSFRPEESPDPHPKTPKPSQLLSRVRAEAMRPGSRPRQ